MINLTEITISEFVPLLDPEQKRIASLSKEDFHKLTSFSFTTKMTKESKKFFQVYLKKLRLPRKLKKKLKKKIFKRRLKSDIYHKAHKPVKWNCFSKNFTAYLVRSIMNKKSINNYDNQKS